MHSQIPFVFFLAGLMATASFAEEPELPGNSEISKQEETSSALPSYRPTFFKGLYPWSLSIGGMESFGLGMDWIFGDYNVLYQSQTSYEEQIPRHILVWSVRTHLIWGDDFGLFLQPNLQYLFLELPDFKVAVGPEIGYWLDDGLDYGISIRLGTLIDLFEVEAGYMVKSERFYIHFLLNLPVGLGYYI